MAFSQSYSALSLIALARQKSLISAYIGSWRTVYLVYGIAELILALGMLRLLEKRPGTVDRFSLKDAYRDALSHPELLKIVGIIFLVGTSVFVSFTYAGKFVESQTGFNIFFVGLILTCFGVATVLAGRKAGGIRQRKGNKTLMAAGVIAAVSWGLIGGWTSPVMLSLSLAGFGLGFNLIQPNLVGTAQQCLPMQRGTVISLASFNMFVGGGIGIYSNGHILALWGYEAIFLFAALLILLAGVFATVLFSRIMPTRHNRSTYIIFFNSIQGGNSCYLKSKENYLPRFTRQLKTKESWIKRPLT